MAGEKDRKFRTEVLEGRHIIRTKRILFETFCKKKYLEAARLNKIPKAGKRNETSITMRKPYFQGRLIQTIVAFQAEQDKKDQKEKGAQATTINRDVASLRNMLNKAVEWGHLSPNPIASARLFTEDNERMWVLTPEEEKKLLEECEKIRQRRQYLSDLARFALHAGRRLREILGLREDRVDFQERFILVTDTKNDEPRSVPINENRDGILKRQTESKNPSEYAFPLFVFCRFALFGFFRRDFIQPNFLQKPFVLLAGSGDFFQKLLHARIGEEGVEILGGIGKELLQDDRFFGGRALRRRGRIGFRGLRIFFFGLIFHR